MQIFMKIDHKKNRTLFFFMPLVNVFAADCTCMQNLMKIDRQKKQAFFNYILRTLFSGHTVHIYIYILIFYMFIDSFSANLFIAVV